jgi:hypothetical protein
MSENHLVVVEGPPHLNQDSMPITSMSAPASILDPFLLSEPTEITGNAFKQLIQVKGLY